MGTKKLRLQRWYADRKDGADGNTRVVSVSAQMTSPSRSRIQEEQEPGQCERGVGDDTRERERY